MATESKSAEAPTSTSEAQVNVKAFLSAHKGKDYENVEDLVMLYCEDSASDALATLTSKGITGAPVFDQVIDTVVSSVPGAVVIHEKQFLGMVDVVDLAQLVLAKGLRRPTASGAFAKLKAFFSVDVAHKVDHAVNLSNRNPFYGLPLTGNLAQAMRILADKGVHRIAVIDTEDKNAVRGIITQSTVVKLLTANMTLLGGMANIPVNQLFATGEDCVMCLPETGSTRDSLDALLTNGHSGAPLVDASGAITANLSATDIVGLAGMSAEAAEAMLEKSALEFVQSRSESGKPRPPVTLNPTDSLGTAMELMVASGVHRVYILDSKRRPRGVVSMTDILRLFTHPVTLLPPSAGLGGEDATEAEAKAADDVAATIVSPAAPELVTTLTSTKVYEYCRAHGVLTDDVVAVPHDMSAAKVLNVLKEKDLSCVPVFREEVADIPGVVGAMWPAAVPAAIPVTERKYIGFCDAADLASLCLNRGVHTEGTGVLAAIASIFKSADDTRDAHAAMNHSGSDPFWAIPVGRGVDQVVRVMGNCKIHRLAVVDTEDKNRVMGLLSQSGVVRFLAANVDKMGALGTSTLARFVDASRPVTTVTTTASTREVLTTMQRSRVTGMPIVDPTDGNKVVSAVSVRDLRGFAKGSKEDEERLLDAPILEFLRDMRAKEAKSADDSWKAPVVVRPADSFATAVALLASSRLHRLFIVDEAGAAVGILTCTDVLRAVAAAMYV